MQDSVQYADSPETRSEASSVRSDAAIGADGLVRRFGPHPAVDGVDLDVRPGEIYGFLGPNGAGKSTVVRMLCTLLRPSAGSARVAGHDVVREAHAVRIRIGVALQEAALDDLQTGRELLRLQGRLFGLTSGQIKQRTAEVLGMVDIGDAIDHRVGTYSGGMKRRLDLAMALIHNPEILFLDEPTTGLDPASRAIVWEEVARLNHELGMTIFLTTQYLEEADVLAHRVGIINRGKLVVEGSPETLKRSIADDLLVAEVVGHDDAEALARLARLPGVRSATREGDRISVRALDGSAVLSPVALTLAERQLEVRSITTRTPTPRRCVHGADRRSHRVTGVTQAAAGDTVIRGRPAGFWCDMVAVADRALRQMRREPASFLPGRVHSRLLLPGEPRRSGPRGRKRRARLQGLPPSDGHRLRGHRACHEPPRWSPTSRADTSTVCVSPRCGVWPSFSG